MRASPSESSCGGGGRSVRGGATGSTARPSPHPCPPRCSGPTGRPLHDPGCVMQSRVSAMNLFAPLFLQPHSPTLCPFFSLPHFPYFYVDQVTLRPRGRVRAPHPGAWASSLGWRSCRGAFDLDCGGFPDLQESKIWEKRTCSGNRCFFFVEFFLWSKILLKIRVRKRNRWHYYLFSVLIFCKEQTSDMKWPVLTVS